MLLWAVSLLTALLVYGQRQLSSFDPNGDLLHRTTAPNFDAREDNTRHKRSKEIRKEESEKKIKEKQKDKNSEQ